MGMYTMRTPSCDSEAEARAEAKADHLANLDPRDLVQQEPECESEWDTRCPECGRMDHDLMYTVSRHVPRFAGSCACSRGGMRVRRDRLRAHWRANNRLTLILLIIWASVSLGGGVLFVEFFNRFTIGNLPLGFWIAQQGSIYVFVLLIFVYAIMMDRSDRRLHADDDESERSK